MEVVTCSVVLWGGKDTANRSHWRVGVALAVSGPHWVCPTYDVCALPVYTTQAPGCSAGELSKAGPGFVHFPGLSHSGSGPQALLKAADSVGPAFSALPRSEQLRQPGAW